MINMSIKEINLEKSFNKKLGMRGIVKKIFQDIEGENEVILNFQGVEFISRSFAQEYVVQRYDSNISLIEINMSDFVKNVIDCVDEDYKTNILGLK